MQPFLSIANWKMNKPFAEALTWYRANADALATLARSSKHELVICPSFETIYALTQMNKAIALGAQDCSAYDRGPYTGQVSAQSLAQIGCTYCIVGHSERRRLSGDTDEIVAQKIMRLFEYAIRPIICIGETIQDRERGTTNAALERQLAPLMKILGSSDVSFVIAYEPIWAIGSGTIPDPASLSAVYAYLARLLPSEILRTQYRLIYGGSVNEKTAPELISIKQIEGFLIGDASLDFQKLQKIVLLRS